MGGGDLEMWKKGCNFAEAKMAFPSEAPFLANVFFTLTQG